MGQKSKILIDTDILIKVYRGNRFHKAILDKEANNLAISSVTYIELLSGLKTRNRIIELNKQMKAYADPHFRNHIYKIIGNCPQIYIVQFNKNCRFINRRNLNS